MPLKGWDALDWSLVDSTICPYFCAKFERAPSCDEEHEAWHALWIQHAVTLEEFLGMMEG